MFTNYHCLNIKNKTYTFISTFRSNSFTKHFIVFFTFYTFSLSKAFLYMYRSRQDVYKFQRGVQLDNRKVFRTSDFRIKYSKLCFSFNKQCTKTIKSMSFLTLIIGTKFQ